MGLMGRPITYVNTSILAYQNGSASVSSSRILFGECSAARIVEGVGVKGSKLHLSSWFWRLVTSFIVNSQSIFLYLSAHHEPLAF